MRVIPDLIKQTIAEAVHQGVCDFTETDGVGQCFYYAAGGFPLATHVTGLEFQPQVGSLHLLIDEPDGWFHMDCEEGGLEREEFHCWLVVLDESRRRAAVWADFSSRYWPEMTQRNQWGVQDAITGDHGTLFVINTQEERIPWSRPQPPPYLWYEGLPPDWIRFSADERAMKTMYRYYQEKAGDIRSLHLAVRHYWMRLSRERGIPTSGRR